MNVSRSVATLFRSAVKGNSFTFRAGTVGDPTTGTHSTGATSQWYAAESLPVASQLSKIQFYLAGDSSVSLLLAVPRAAGGFTVSIIATKSAIAGLNTYTVAAGELPATTIPANSFIGVKCATNPVRYTADTTAYSRVRSGGHVYCTTWTGAGVYHLEFTDQDEMSIAWEATATRGQQEYLVDESFSTARPAWTIHGGTAWTYAAGSATPGATGIVNRLSWAKSSCAHLQTLRVEFMFDDSSGKMVFGKSAITNLIQDGTLVSISIATNQIELYATHATVTTLPAVFDTKDITAFTLVTGRVYSIEMIKVNKEVSVRVTDTVTGETQLFTWTVSASYGYALGRPTVFSLGGAFHLTRVRWSLGNTRPRFMIYGDSITEGTGSTSNLSGYAGQLCDGRDGMFAGDGGVRTYMSLRHMIFDVRNIMPEYVILNCGVNDSSSDAVRDQGIADFRTFWARCRQYGTIPILACPTTYNNAAIQTRITAIRDAMVSDAAAHGIGLIRFDLAVGGVTGAVYDAAKMSDSAHPNQIGYDDMTVRGISDQPAVFN